MGQSYSTNSHGKEDPGGGEGKKADYYDLLHVERDATGEEIKKAYRKRALELHPDRNYGNVDAATALFAEIQSAYEVLSDPQERAWYDSHRDVFLGRDDRSEKADYSYDTRMTTPDDLFKLFSRFSPRMEFSDSPSGFYGGLRETFAQLASEERAACHWDKIAFTDYPSFGNRDHSFEEVVRPFYAVWGSFSTKKSFAWKDVYRYSEAPDRRVRRLMEKENKRLRDDGIREFNEAVRSLVAFVKKRDPRYKANAKSELQRQEILRQSAATQAARSRAVNQAKLRDHVVQDWAKSGEPEEDTSDLSDQEREHYECVVCHKNFKSQNQFEAHERSKKHIKAVKQLRWEMRTQNIQLDLEDASFNHEKELQASQTVQDNPEDRPLASTETGTSVSQSIDEKSRKFTGARVEDNSRTSLIEDGTAIQHSDETAVPCIDDPEGSVSDRDEADYASREAVEDRLHSLQLEGYSEADTMDKSSRNMLNSELEEQLQPTKEMGKAKQKRARRAKRSEEQPKGLTCTTCSSTFPSKTQLFSHIRDLDHAQPLRAVYGNKRGHS